VPPLVWTCLRQIDNLFYGHIHFLADEECLHVFVNQSLARFNTLLGCAPREPPIFRSVRQSARYGSVVPFSLGSNELIQMSELTVRPEDKCKAMGPPEKCSRCEARRLRLQIYALTLGALRRRHP
jgi:hypothetical protein